MIGALFEFTASILVEFAFYTVFHGPGWVMLRTLALGRYPPRRTIPHNREFVALTPIVSLFVVLTLVYS